MQPFQELSAWGAVPLLVALSAVVLLPLTLYKNASPEVGSLGYAGAISACGVFMTAAFWSVSSGTLLMAPLALTAYGLRVATVLFVAKAEPKPLDAPTDAATWWNRLATVSASAIMYGFLVSPCFFALQPQVYRSQLPALALVGMILAWAGVLGGGAVKERVGTLPEQWERPSQPLFSAIRQPAYGFDMLFWVGIFLVGLPSFGARLVPWFCGLRGLVGVLMLLQREAQEAVEAEEHEAYKGQAEYENWVALKIAVRAINATELDMGWYSSQRMAVSP